jgi:RNA polymerase sigma-70 factor, ECF subfamily
MPPLRHRYHGLDAVADFALRVPMTRCPSWRSVPTDANGQPAVAFCVGAHHTGPHRPAPPLVCYRPGPTKRGHQPHHVLLDAGLFARFGLPTQLS